MGKPKKIQPSHDISPFWRTTWPDFDRVFDIFRRDFDRPFGAFPFLGPISMPPISPCDLVDEGHKFLLTTEIPGVNKEDIKLNISENNIEILAERKETEEEKKRNYLRKERREISYHRTLSFPEKVDSEKAKAKLENGILTIEIPKITPTPKPKSTSITVQ